MLEPEKHAVVAHQKVVIVYQIRSAKNGDILGVGHFRNSGPLPSKGKGWLFRMTNTGEPLWERHYSDSLLRPWSPHLELLDLCEMDDGRIAATGIVFDFNGEGVPWNPNLVLLVLGADGCLEPGCDGPTQYITATSEPIIKFDNLPVLGISPNPSAGPVTISLPETLALASRDYELRCYAPNGQLLRRFDWPLGAPSLRIDDWSVGGMSYLFLFDKRGYPVASGRMLVHR